METESYDKGELVWAKLKGYPWWPSVVVETYKTESQDNDQDKIEILVNFIGENSHATLSQNNVAKYQKNFKQYSQTKYKKCQESIIIAQKIYNGQSNYEFEKKQLDYIKKQTSNKRSLEGAKSNSKNKEQKVQKENLNKKVKVDQAIISSLSQEKFEKVDQMLKKGQILYISDIDQKDVGQIELILQDFLQNLEQQNKIIQSEDILKEQLKSAVQRLDQFLSCVEKQQLHSSLCCIFKSQIGVNLNSIIIYLQNSEIKLASFRLELDLIKNRFETLLINQEFNWSQLINSLYKNDSEELKNDFDNKEESIFNQSDNSLREKSESQQSKNPDNNNQEIRKQACKKLAKIFNHKYGFEKKQSEQKTLQVEQVIRSKDPSMKKDYRELMSLVLKLSNYKLFDIQNFISDAQNIQEYRNILSSYEQEQINQSNKLQK